MKIYYILIPLLFSLNSFAMNYSKLQKSGKLSYSDGKNNLRVVFDLQEQEVKSILINKQVIKIIYSDIFNENDNRFYSLDLNSDGYKDYAFNSAIGMKNKYFYYLIYNPKTKSFISNQVSPKLERSKKGELFGFEFDGIKKTRRTYIIRDYRLTEIK